MLEGSRRAAATHLNYESLNKAYHFHLAVFSFFFLFFHKDLQFINNISKVSGLLCTFHSYELEF